MPEPDNVTFLDLGQDIIESEVIPLLTPSEIHQLQLTNKTLNHIISNSPFVWQQLYKKTFGSVPTPFTKWGSEMYKSRSAAKVYSWGCFSGGRLGFSLKDVPAGNVSKVRFNIGIMKPTLIPGLDDEIVADVSAGGFSFQLLTASGKIFTTGSSYHQGHLGAPGPTLNDYNKFQLNNSHHRFNPHTEINFFPVDVGRRGEVLNIIPGPAPTATEGARPTPMPQTITPSSPFITNEPSNPHPSHDLKPSNKFLKREYTTRDSMKFVSVSSGRAHFIALDNAGNLWSWDRSEFGVKLKFESFDPATKGLDLVKDLGCKILKICAGWGYSVAYLYNYGLVYWTQRDPLREFSEEEEAKAHFVVIPETRIDPTADRVNQQQHKRVVDFLTLENRIIYITQDGKLWATELSPTNTSQPLTTFQNELISASEWTGCKFTRLTGVFQSFAVFSDADYVFIGDNSVKPDTKPLMIPELQQRKCIDVRFGDHHKLALLSNGTILSWGLQLSNCGCLGLGATEGVVAEGVGRITDSHNSVLSVEKPTEIPLPEGKRAIAIAAAGWQSSAIIV